MNPDETTARKPSRGGRYGRCACGRSLQKLSASQCLRCSWPRGVDDYDAHYKQAAAEGYQRRKGRAARAEVDITGVALPEGANPVALDWLRSGKAAVDPESGCWLWVKSTNNGCPVINLDGKLQQACRVAVRATTDVRVERLCRNRLCVNPAHQRVVEGHPQTSQALCQRKTVVDPADVELPNHAAPIMREWIRVGHVTPLTKDECWLWQLSFDVNGYPVTHGDGRLTRATRLAIDCPKNLMAAHSCDNPSCVNPWHLRAATHRENMEDTRGKRNTYGQCPCGRARHPLSEYCCRCMCSSGPEAFDQARRLSNKVRDAKKRAALLAERGPDWVPAKAGRPRKNLLPDQSAPPPKRGRPLGSKNTHR